jgi:hypothetical protein
LLGICSSQKDYWISLTVKSGRLDRTVAIPGERSGWKHCRKMASSIAFQSPPDTAKARK